MSPLGLYVATALILLAAAAVGSALLAIAGRREWSWTAPALGLAALVVVGLVAQLPGRAVTVAALLAVTVAGAVVVLARSRPGPGPRAAVWTPIVALVLLAASVPFAAGGGFDVMGTYVNNDLNFHLYNAEWLRSHEGVEPQQVADGYPLGPHGLVLGVSTLTGIALTEVWTALLMATAVVTALASLSVIGRLGWPVRIVGALLVGTSYLGAAFYVQSAFKETLMAAFVLGFGLAVREAVREGPEPEAEGERSGLVRLALAPAVFAAAAAAAYGLPGLAWPVGITGVWFATRWALDRWAERRADPGAEPLSVRRITAAAVAAVAVAAGLGYLAFDRSADYVGGRDAIGSESLANLFDPLPPSQALGLWVSSDYRITDVSFLGQGGAFTVLLALVGIAAVALGVRRLARDREIAVLSALVVGAGAWVVASMSLGPYVASKALAIVAPLVMLAAIVGIAPAPAERAAPAPGGGAENDLSWIARTILACAFVAIALGSSYVALAGARLDRDDHAAQLSSFRDEVEGHTVLFLGSDEHAAYDLRGAAVKAHYGTAPGLYETGRRQAGARTGERVDLDAYEPQQIDLYDYVILPNSLFASALPENFRRVDETESFVLYERTGPTPDFQPPPEGDIPGALLECNREVRALDGTALVWTEDPVVAPFGDEYGYGPAGGSFPEWVNEGQPVSRTLALEAGSWEISLQYHSLEPVDVDVGGLLQVELPPNSSRIGPLWRVGEIELDEPTDVVVTVQPQTRPEPRSLLSFERARTGPETVLGVVGAVPADGEREEVPVREACGRIVDRLDVDLEQ